jgi:hypothetical protein
MSNTEKSEPSSETTRLVEGIEKTRSEMSGTIATLEHRLNTADIRAKVEGELHHVEEKVREVVRDQLADAKALVKEELLEAKTLLREEMNEAESKIKKGLAEAKENVKTEVREAIVGAKRSVRAATLGKVEDLATRMGDSMNDTRDTLIETIRSNPLPAAVAGVGIAWLVMNRSSAARREDGRAGRRAYTPRRGGSRSDEGIKVAFKDTGHEAGDLGDKVADAVHDVTDAAGDVVHRVSDAASSAVHSATETVGSLAHQASDAAGSAVQSASEMAGQLVHEAGDAATHLASGARKQAHRVEERFQATLHENPLAVGAAAVALGAVIGYALPRTHGEDVLMGDTRDEMLRRAGGATTEAADLVGRFADKTVETAKGLLDEGTRPGGGRSDQRPGH